jgi:hypothetical protein
MTKPNEFDALEALIRAAGESTAGQVPSPDTTPRWFRWLSLLVVVAVLVLVVAMAVTVTSVF